MNRKECESNLIFPASMSGTGLSETQTLSIKPCDLCEECYVKGEKHWCNHCVECYQILEEIIHNNKNIPLGVLMGYTMKQLRGNYSGVLVQKILELLKHD